MKREYLLPIALAVILIVLVGTAVQLAGALGRVSVLREQIEDWRDSTLVAQEAVVVADAAFDSIVVVAQQEEVQATVAIAEAQAEVIVQEAEAEASFRRAVALAADNPVLERAIEEMRAEAIVTSMEHEALEAESAAAFFEAQQRIRTLITASEAKDEAQARELFTVNASLSLALQTIEEQQNVIAPSFFTRIFDMPEVALFGAVIGATAVFVVVR